MNRQELVRMIADGTIHIVNANQLEHCTFHICGENGAFPGSQKTQCALCARDIWFTVDHPKLQKVCYSCAMQDIRQDSFAE